MIQQPTNSKMFSKALLCALLALCLSHVALAAPTKNFPTASLDNAYYIWTNETSKSNPFEAPLGSRAFRKTVNFPNSSPAAIGSVIMRADDEFTLYVNGKLIGNGTLSEGDKHFNFTLDHPSHRIVIAVNATNTQPTYADLIGAYAFDSAHPCPTEGPVNGTTDGTWKFSLTVPTGFERPNYDDSNWRNVTVQGHH